MKLPVLSKTKLKTIVRLKQKKFRLQEGLVVIDGIRSLSQIQAYGITPLEQYCVEGAGSPIWGEVPAYSVRDWEMGRICSSEHPQNVAALFSVPEPRKVDFRLAFYLDGISDPGNLGTIFRLVAAFDIDCACLSPDCVEISSPKVIRSSLGSVYHVPFEILSHTRIRDTGARIFIADSHEGLSIKEFHPLPDEKVIVALGSEAHGVSEGLRSLRPEKLHIQTSSHIESLNVSIAAGIIAHHLYTA